MPFRTMKCLSAFSCLWLLLTACEPKSISQLSDDEGIQRIRKNHQEKRWEQLIQEVSEYKSRYPYSPHAVEADLLLGDTYFESRRYPEAFVQYEDFSRRNPKHPKVPLACYRMAKSLEAQAPKEIDREQVYSIRAVERYEHCLSQYPADEFKREAQESLKVLRMRIIDHAIFIAKFYAKKDLPHAALSRYLKVLSDPSVPEATRKVARKNAADAYRSLANELEKDRASDATIYFRNQTPEGLRKLASELEKE